MGSGAAEKENQKSAGFLSFRVSEERESRGVGGDRASLKKCVGLGWGRGRSGLCKRSGGGGLASGSFVVRVPGLVRACRAAAARCPGVRIRGPHPPSRTHTLTAFVGVERPPPGKTRRAKRAGPRIISRAWEPFTGPPGGPVGRGVGGVLSSRMDKDGLAGSRGARSSVAALPPCRCGA